MHTIKTAFRDSNNTKQKSFEVKKKTPLFYEEHGRLIGESYVVHTNLRVRLHKTALLTTQK